MRRDGTPQMSPVTVTVDDGDHVRQGVVGDLGQVMPFPADRDEVVGETAYDGRPVPDLPGPGGQRPQASYQPVEVGHRSRR